MLVGPCCLDEGSYKDSTEVSRMSAFIQFGSGAVDDPACQSEGFNHRLDQQGAVRGYCHEVWCGY